MGYDMLFVRVLLPSGQGLPAGAPASEGLLEQAQPLEDREGIREALLSVQGCRQGPGEAVDYVGRGLNYARFEVKEREIYIENGCTASELLKIHGQLSAAVPGLLIFDLQSRQLHDAGSFAQWWSRPL